MSDIHDILCILAENPYACLIRNNRCNSGINGYKYKHIVFIREGCAIKKVISSALERIGDKTPVKQIKPVSGGSINEAFKLETESCQYFIKLKKGAPRNFFKKEAEGLNLIRSTHTSRVPEVYDCADAKGQDNTGILMLQWIEGQRNNQTEIKLGQRLAHMHGHESKFYGLKTQTFIGELKQFNGLFTSWVNYYREQRLFQQIELGKQRGTIKDKRYKKLITLLDNLHRFLPDNVAASLLHGDLWGGNWMAGPEGEPYLIDPSVFYGDREMDMAFTEVFGGFSTDFYSAYQEVYPLSGEYEDRKALYQLYYLLVHLNLFGESYGSGVDRILDYYV
ncbi:fructosamine kinase family protein [Scopulibacillus cellulosilyticus]|uniref:Fructosamine kinase family protein n=1 Tax=Scopulibacillus cellulosilyticus TaxID=2665665 RepID=A0ABW2PR82_9BACL